MIALAPPVSDEFATDWKPYVTGRLADAVDTAVERATLDALEHRVIEVARGLALGEPVAPLALAAAIAREGFPKGEIGRLLGRSHGARV